MATEKDLMNKYVDLEAERAQIDRMLDKSYEAAQDLVKVRDISDNSGAVNEALNIIEENIAYHTVNRNSVQQQASNVADAILEKGKKDE